MSFGYTVLGFGSGASDPYVAATGGTVTTDGDFKVHPFTSSGTFTVTNPSSSVSSIEYLVIAGGGGGGAGGGANAGGGAGAGGYRTATGLGVTSQAYSITVGAGGAGNVYNQDLTSGGNSAAIGITSTRDRKSTRLNSSHGYISYAVFCLKQKKKKKNEVLK